MSTLGEQPVSDVEASSILPLNPSKPTSVRSSISKMAVPRTPPPPFGSLPGSLLRPSVPPPTLSLVFQSQHIIDVATEKKEKNGKKCLRLLARSLEDIFESSKGPLSPSIFPSLRSNHPPLSFSISPIRTWNRKFFPSAAAAARMRRREWEIKDPFVSKMPLPLSQRTAEGRPSL